MSTFLENEEFIVALIKSKSFRHLQNITDRLNSIPSPDLYNALYLELSSASLKDIANLCKFINFDDVNNAVVIELMMTIEYATMIDSYYRRIAGNVNDNSTTIQLLLSYYEKHKNIISMHKIMTQSIQSMLSADDTQLAMQFYHDKYVNP